MRQPNRTLKCRNLFPVLYTNWLHPTLNCPHFNPKLNRNTQLPNPLPHNTPPTLNMIQHHSMTSMYNSIYSQNTIIRSPSMITKSPRRSSNCRLYNFSSNSPKARGLWDNTSFHHSRPPNKIFSLPIHHPLIMRHNYN